MANIANITVKKADGSTNIVWTALFGAAGTAPATWRSDTVGTQDNLKPVFRLTSVSNGPGTARRIVPEFSYPSVYTDSSTGLKAVVSTVVFKNGAWTVPHNVPDTDKMEAAAQFANLMKDSQVVASLVSGYAPN